MIRSTSSSGPNFWSFWDLRFCHCRFFVLGTHYRHPLNFSWEALDAAANGLRNLRGDVARLSGAAGLVPFELAEEFLKVISDDLNMPQALALVQELLKGEWSDSEKLAAVAAWDKVFGLKLMDRRDATIPTKLIEKLSDYGAARRSKDYPRSDALRSEFAQAGYNVEDLSDGSSRLIPSR